ncbi:MAG TPA: aminotransferase class I/II-fold pyridoxal phosphate-dependent enzyme [Actinomycetota bacterium]
MTTSSVLAAIARDLAPVLDFVENSAYAKRWGDPSISDFVFGNPHDMPLPGIANALTRWTEPEDKNWYAYQRNEPDAVATVVSSLRESHGLAFEPEDVFLTPGAFGALSVTLRALLDPGDEVVFLSPPWFFYEAMIRLAGAAPVRVRLEPPAFDPDPAAVEAALTERTRAIILNTPHNPSGRLYGHDELAAVAGVLRTAAGRNGRPITVLADEAYRRILFDGRSFTSPAAVYDDTIVLYTYGKTLLAPGERFGYAALHPSMENRPALREALTLSQIVGGWQFPNAILQKAIGDLNALSIDVGALQARRDRLAAALPEMGYELIVPEGTFYMLVRSPVEDDVAFTESLAAHDVFVGPGTIFELPGWLRLSLTANDDMVERSLPGFAAALDAVRPN